MKKLEDVLKPFLTSKMGRLVEVETGSLKVLFVRGPNHVRFLIKYNTMRNSEVHFLKKYLAAKLTYLGKT